MDQACQKLRRERQVNCCLSAIVVLLILYIAAGSGIYAWLVDLDGSQPKPPASPRQQSISHSANLPISISRPILRQEYQDMVTNHSTSRALTTIITMTDSVPTIAEPFTKLFEDYFDETRVVSGNWVPGTAPKTGVNGTAPMHGLRFDGTHHRQEFERLVSSTAEAMKEVGNTRRLAHFETVGCKLSNQTTSTMGAICIQDQDISTTSLAAPIQILDDPRNSTQFVFHLATLQAKGCAGTARRHQKLPATLQDINRMQKSLTRLITAEEKYQEQTAPAWEFWKYWAGPAKSLRSIKHFNDRLELAVQQSEYVTFPTAEQMKQAGQVLGVRAANLTLAAGSVPSGEQHKIARELACVIFAHEMLGSR